MAFISLRFLRTTKARGESRKDTRSQALAKRKGGKNRQGRKEERVNQGADQLTVEELPGRRKRKGPKKISSALLL
jgi:hypothetical protein